MEALLTLPSSAGPKCSVKAGVSMKPGGLSMSYEGKRA